jgi:hypothetical protein
MISESSLFSISCGFLNFFWVIQNFLPIKKILEEYLNSKILIPLEFHISSSLLSSPTVISSVIYMPTR